MAKSGGLLQGILVLNGTVTGSEENYLSDDMNHVCEKKKIDIAVS